MPPLLLALTCWAWVSGQYRPAPCTTPGAFPVINPSPELEIVKLEVKEAPATTIQTPPPLLTAPFRRQPAFRVEPEPFIPSKGLRMYDMPQHLSRKRAYLWTITPHLLDQVSTEFLLSTELGYEWHPWGKTRNWRLLKGAAASIAAAEVIYRLEKRPGKAAKVGRYLWVGGCITLAVRNTHLAQVAKRR